MARLRRSCPRDNSADLESDPHSSMDTYLHYQMMKAMCVTEVRSEKCKRGADVARKERDCLSIGSKNTVTLLL
jgi:hypothetical protein